MAPRARRTGVLLLAGSAACFNPKGSDTTDDGSTAGGPGTTAAVTTVEPATTATPTSTTGDGTTGTTDAATTTSASTTGGGCSSAGGCPKETPYCLDGECVECRYHHECKLACDLAVGTCFPADTLEFVVVPAPECTDCGNGASCCSVDEALKKAAVAPAQYVVIQLASAPVDPRPVDLTTDLGGKTIAIVGQPPQGTLAAAGMSALRIDQSTTTPSRVYLWRLIVQGSAVPSLIDCVDAPLWLDEVQILDNVTGIGLATNNCDVTVRRSFVLRHLGAISTVGGRLVLRDTIVGGSDPTGSELALGAGSVVDARYATIVDDDAGAATLIACIDPGTLAFENSIVVGATPDGSVAGCDGHLAASRSVVSTSSLADNGVANTLAVHGDLSFMPDLRLSAKGGPAENVAVWRDGFLPLDIDGTARPTVDGQSDYAGADIPP